MLLLSERLQRLGYHIERGLTIFLIIASHRPTTSLTTTKNTSSSIRFATKTNLTTGNSRQTVIASTKTKRRTIEGIEEREESPKSKAKAKSATTKAEADDPRTLSLEEQAKAETILNDFQRNDIKRIEESKNIDITQEYLRDTSK